MTEEMEQEVKEAANVSMGTEISEEDISNILELCNQVISISEYREQLYDYLKNRMNAIAPNLTMLVGELVGARLIAHAGSLLNLAKHPASTVQILGAEKALFRALKTKHETPKYGLIYHASLVGQTAPKFKGRISRVLAAKAALACRYDALGEGETNTLIGTESRTKVEQRLRTLETGATHRISGTAKQAKKFEKYDNSNNQQNIKGTKYNTAADDTTAQNGDHKKTPSKKDFVPETMEAEETEPTPVPEKKKKKRSKAEEDPPVVEEAKPEKKRKKERQEEAPVVAEEEVVVEKKKKKKTKTQE
jgi:nucleolar protein 58